MPTTKEPTVPAAAYELLAQRAAHFEQDADRLYNALRHARPFLGMEIKEPRNVARLAAEALESYEALKAAV